MSKDHKKSNKGSKYFNAAFLKQHPLLAGDEDLQYLAMRQLHGNEVTWGDIAELSEENVRAFGIEEALHRSPTPSPRRPSSGESYRMTRKERKEHYKRKGQLEDEKEKARLKAWMAKNPEGDPMDWVAREKTRRERKERERKSRKALRKSSSSGKRK
jgi:hypothetical protein